MFAGNEDRREAEQPGPILRLEPVGGKTLPPVEMLNCRRRDRERLRAGCCPADAAQGGCHETHWRGIPGARLALFVIARGGRLVPELVFHPAHGGRLDRPRGLAGPGVRLGHRRVRRGRAAPVGRTRDGQAAVHSRDHVDGDRLGERLREGPPAVSRLPDQVCRREPAEPGQPGHSPRSVAAETLQGQSGRHALGGQGPDRRQRLRGVFQPAPRRAELPSLSWQGGRSSAGVDRALRLEEAIRLARSAR